MRRILKLVIILIVFFGFTLPLNAKIVLDQQVVGGNSSFGVDELFAQ